jgi:KUP system potassium uptake protein
VLGGNQVVRQPRSCGRSTCPRRHVLPEQRFTGFLVLGAVILVVVGGEALYADMGHFGRRPIMIGWYAVVLPSLILVYFGQGALLIDDPSAVENPFYRLAPEWALFPLVALATLATIIASQALISGAYSITQQAVQLGFSPRVRIRHTSETERGQIYISSINWFLMVACIALVVGFRSSTSLAAAYGLAVSTTMVITSVLFSVVARQRFGWKPWFVVPLCTLFLVIDLAFFGATVFKIPDGGWFPLVVAAFVFSLLSTWRTGRRLVRDRLLRGGLPIETFVRDLAEHPPIRVPGAAAYLFATPGVTPPTLLSTIHHNDSLHEQVLLISIITEEIPHVHKLKRATVVDLGAGFHRVELHFGFMDDPDVPVALAERVVMKLGERDTHLLPRP